MGVISDAAQPRGDIMRRLAELERQVQALSTARRLEAATVGRGGVRIKGGRLLAEDLNGGRVFEVTTNPATIFMRDELISSLVQDVVQELLSSQAGQDLVKFIIGEAFHTASASGIVSTASSTFVSLTGGPELTDVIVSDARKLLVLVGSNMQVTNDHTGGMSFEVSGASTIAPNDTWGQVVSYQDPDTGGVGVRALAGALFTQADGINAGTHTIEAKYHRLLGLTSNIQFSERTLFAIGF